MVAKSIVDIDVNDDKFVAFMERFREYQSALDDLPEAWRVADLPPELDTTFS